MSIPLTYQDTIRLVETTSDEYGKEVYSDEATVAAIFEQATGWRHQSNADAMSGDATAFVDPTDEFVLSKFNQLEGMLLIADPFGLGSWYRVVNVSVSRDTQFANEVNVIQLTLKKTVGITGIS